MEEKSFNKIEKSFFRRFWWLGVIIILIAFGVAFSLIKNNWQGKSDQSANNKDSLISTAEDKDQNKIEWPSLDAKYITAVPLDLAQIQSISKYRSCAGHDFSGYSFERDLETDRSMKHYFYPVAAFQGTIDKVKMFAPFDGTVSKIDSESDQIGQPGKRPQTGNGITFSTPSDQNVNFEFAHIYFVKNFKVGDEIKAGEIIGYAALGDKGNDFDIVLAGVKSKEQSTFGSAFDHMTDEVLAEFAKYGIAPENIKVTKEYRDANPCNYANSSSPDNRASDGWVKLLH